MLIALLCESEMKLADDTIEVILDQVCCLLQLLLIPKQRSFIKLKPYAFFGVNRHLRTQMWTEMERLVRQSGVIS